MKKNQRPLMVKYEITCGKGCGRKIGFLEFPNGTPRPDDATNGYFCSKCVPITKGR